MNQRVAVRALLGLALLLVPQAASAAPAAQPPLDQSKLPYQPIGHFKPGAPLAAPDSCSSELLPLRTGEIFNPSGTFNAFDTNVFEVLCYPFRGPGDKTTDDPVGPRGAKQHGFCGGPYEPSSDDGRELGTFTPIAGTCHNHQLEWSRYYAATMKEILGDFGVTIRQYAFDVEPPGLTGNTRYGRALNTAAVVPGADHPDETVIVGAHYDKTNDGPASAWDSQEGHAEMVRMAKLMADYWRATGTRPSATVKFIPWDAEESGTFGSLDYAENNIVPGEEFKVRGYWNTDPCAGGYPSFRYGNPGDRLRMGIQLADPGAISGITAADAARISAFNGRARTLVEQVLDHVDDSVETLAGPVETFRSAAEGGSDVGRTGGIAIGTDRPILFSSDWRNFEVLGIPFFNPGPEVTGPNQNTDGSLDFGVDQSADAIAAFHNPLDNLSQLMRFTGGGLDGTRYSGSWAKGMEFCSHMLAWGMLQHDQGGAQTASKDVVAYYEALPNEAIQGQKVVFDAEGTHQLTDTGTRAKADPADLELRWDFGDGAKATGMRVEHQYGAVGKYVSKLTVRNRRTGATDVMEVPITVEGSDFAPPVLAKPAAAQDADGTFDLRWDYEAGERGAAEGFVVEEAPDAATVLDDRADDLSRWTAETPKGAEGLQPWQLSDSETDKPRGNLHQSPPRSFWTGLSRADSLPLTGPGQGESQLVLKEPVTLPRGTSSLLTFASDLGGDNNDQARVDVAIDTGGALPLEWEPVERIKVSEDTGKYAYGPEQAFTQGPAFEQRVVDLSRFAGRSIRIRFALALGAPQFVNVVRTGWYVDDIRLVRGSFKEIGRTTQPTFTVSGKRKGTYAYRVRAAFADGITTAPSNVEAVEVTQGVAAASTRCATASGFTRARVVPRPRGALRFDLRLTGSPATVDVFRATAGRSVVRRRVARFRRDGSFTWSGRVRGRRVAPGIYYVKLRTPQRGGGTDTRYVALQRTSSAFRRLPAFQRVSSCGLLSRFGLSHPAFSARRGLSIRLAVTQRARVSVAVFRGTSTRAVRRFRTRTLAANRPVRLDMVGRGLRRGEYRVVVTAVKGRERVRTALRSRRI